MFRECDYGSEEESVRKEVYDYYMKDVDPKDKRKITERMVEVTSESLFSSESINAVDSCLVDGRLCHQLWNGAIHTKNVRNGQRRFFLLL